MPGGRRAATAAQLALHGAFAAKLRGMLKQRQWSISDLNAALGRPRHYSPSRVWLNGSGGVSEAMRPVLAKALELSEAELFGETAPLPAIVGRPLVNVGSRPPEVLLFSVLADGSSRLRLDVVLPIEQGAPLLRMLLDAGLVMGKGGKEKAC